MVGGCIGHIFVAVVPQGLTENADVKRLVGKLKRTFKEKSIEARWTHPDLWHVTVQFLGELSDDRKSDLVTAVSEWRPDVSELRLSLHTLGGFPTSEQARVLWLGVHQNQGFLDLQSSLAAHLAVKGFGEEEREFRPHLTLARIRNPRSITDLVGLAGRKQWGDFPVTELIVFESVLQGNIIRYLPLARQALSKG